MIFFFKPKKIHLDCFTNRNDVYTYFPIVKANKTFPDWWKNLPKNSNRSTMKNCVGFLDYFKNSVALRLWSDLEITLKKDPMPIWSWEFSDDKSQITSHSPHLFENYIDPTENQQLQLLFNHNESPTILEVFTPTRDNDKILLQFFKELASEFFALLLALVCHCP